jgi:hypothetical protein
MSMEILMVHLFFLYICGFVAFIEPDPGKYQPIFAEEALFHCVIALKLGKNKYKSLIKLDVYGNFDAIFLA